MFGNQPSAYVVASLGSDVQFCTVETANQPKSPGIAYMTTDRPIYRPSQTVHFKAVIRDRVDNKLSLLK